ncbi:Leucine rich repeat [Popillia japonica]|uniref:Leucine rich repeat n=1 Tax=Popillia japonica TaxID=7064 RepID=A0AAW1MKX2_POPJA
MFRSVLLCITSLLISSSLGEECTALSGLEIIVCGGGECRKTQATQDNLEDAYKIIVENKNIPAVCKNTFVNLHRLDSLKIDASGIKSLEPSAFDNLPSLRNLIITNNNIPEINSGVFGNLLMRKLNLSSNGISKISSKAFENMMNLEVLDLSSNKLKVFENNWFEYTPKLYRLDFMHNQIAAIPENAFVNIIKNKQVKDNLELWFMYNSIDNIHKKAFNKIEKIQSLWLSHNLLNQIDVEVFANVQHIQTLYLDNNMFTCFEDNFLKHLKVKELDIDGNPIDCECLNKIKKLKRERDIEIQHLRIGLRCVLNKLRQFQDKEDLF